MEIFLSDAMKIQKWKMNGLPSDSFSITNGVILYNCEKWPLLIDPQSQATKWLKNNEIDQNICSIKQNDKNFFQVMESCLQFGYSCLIENAAEELDMGLDGLISKQFFKNSGVLSVRLGENICEYNKDFKLFISTKISNPHYFPEISTKVILF